MAKDPQLDKQALKLIQAMKELQAPPKSSGPNYGIWAILIVALGAFALVGWVIWILGA